LGRSISAVAEIMIDVSVDQGLEAGAEHDERDGE
jgi:hypothetical protein